MNKNFVKVLIAMLLFASSIFCADIIFTGGAFSSFYVCVILLSLWSDDDRLLIGGTIGSVVLIFGAYGYFLINYDTSSAISSAATFGFAGFINKLISIVMVIITSGLASRSKEKSENLKRLNETLELRVLARIAASEAKAKRLEKQIEILQAIRKEDINNSFSVLDEVINNLKTLAVERNDSNFEAIK
jgi:hypothetical protein